MNSRDLNRVVITLATAASLGCVALAQQNGAQENGAQPNATASPQAQAAPAWSPAQSVGMFSFPRNAQSQDQQLKDESECYGMAKQRTGFDPQKGSPTAPTSEQVQAAQSEAAQNAQQAKGARAGGAARGAAGGAAIGAITGSAGTGAAVGAVAGTMAGGGRQRSANAQAQQKSAAQAKARVEKEHEQQMLAHEEGLDTFQRAFAACMDARGYSVK